MDKIDRAIALRGEVTTLEGKMAARRAELREHVATFTAQESKDWENWLRYGMRRPATVRKGH